MLMTTAKGLEWQVRVWDYMTPMYVEEVDRRFIPVLDYLMVRAKLQPGHRVLDVGTGCRRQGVTRVAVSRTAAPDRCLGAVVTVDVGTGGTVPGTCYCRTVTDAAVVQVLDAVHVTVVVSGDVAVTGVCTTMRS